MNPRGNPDVWRSSPQATPKYDPEAVADALRTSLGVASVAAEKIGCPADAVRRYVRQYEVCRLAQIEGRERFADHAEVALIGATRDREAWAVRMALLAHGRERGYVSEFGTIPVDAATACVAAIVAVLREKLSTRDPIALREIFESINQLAGADVIELPALPAPSPVAEEDTK